MISKSTHVRRAEQQRMFCCCYFCFALFFAPNALWWWAWGWRRFLWSISEKKLGLMVVSPISRSSFVCCLGCWNQYLVGSLSRVRDLPKKHHRLLFDSLEEEEEHHFSEKKPAPLDRLPAQVQYCPTYYIKDSIDPDNVTLTLDNKQQKKGSY